MEPNDGSQPVIQDSVVGRDMHTGNVIHNHYHLPPTPTVVQPPQTVIAFGQSQPATTPYPQPVFIPYKKLYSLDWLLFGILSIFLAFAPGINFCCAFTSGIGVLSLLPHLKHTKANTHPESGKIIPAIVLNLIAIFIVVFVTVFVFSDF